MKFGIMASHQYPHTDDLGKHLSDLFGTVELAAELGYDSVWTINHFQSNLATPQPISMMTSLIPRSGNMTLGTGILLLPLFHPVHVAEEFATLDHLSGGRVVLGVGAGYRENEFAAFGIDPDTRFRRLDESLRLIRALWSGQTVHQEGEFYPLSGASIGVRPLTRAARRSGSVPAAGRPSAARPGSAMPGTRRELAEPEVPSRPARRVRRRARGVGQGPGDSGATGRRRVVLCPDHRAGGRGGSPARADRVRDVRGIPGAALAARPFRRPRREHPAARVTGVPDRADLRPARPGLQPHHLPTGLAGHADREGARLASALRQRGVPRIPLTAARGLPTNRWTREGSCEEDRSRAPGEPVGRREHGGRPRGPRQVRPLRRG
ncbi:LLM class flavin-dependent oxidoreductase [Streptomyces sp. INA 01156]